MKKLICFFKGHNWQYHCRIQHKYRVPSEELGLTETDKLRSVIPRLPPQAPSHITAVQRVVLHRYCPRCQEYEDLHCDWRTV